MLNSPRLLFHVQRFAAVATILSLAACSGCGNCTVPPFVGPPGLGPVTQCNQGANAIPLGPALAPFAVLAGSAVSNVGNTLVTFAPGAVTGSTNDDLVGVWPGTSVTGFYPPGTVTDGMNAIYAAGFNNNPAVPMAAQGGLTTAYNTAASRPMTASVAGDLGGQILGPGVYKSTSTLAIMNGNLTLDGGGNPQSVFIFQMVSSLTTVLNGTAGGNVILINGANACNIYWQVGSSATLGGATFFGNIFAFSSITINASTFTGRALAGGSALGTGAVSIPVAGGSLITNPGGN
jgi:ice-binding like protein